MGVGVALPKDANEMRDLMSNSEERNYEWIL